MKQMLLALACALILGGAALAQPLARKPVSNVALLKATAKRAASEAPAIVVPAVAVEAEDVTPTYNSEAAKVFATKIHPILMNVCAGCHSKNDVAGTFKLKRVDDGYANAQGVERNLLATVKQIDPANPGASPLLVKAVTAHGKSKEPPFLSKTSPAYRSLELWAYWATMRDGSPLPSSIPQTVTKRPEPAALPAPANPIQPVAATKPIEPTKPTENFAVQPKSAEPGRVNPDDPFDPGSFNRAAHPMRK